MVCKMAGMTVDWMDVMLADELDEKRVYAEVGMMAAWMVGLLA